MPTSVLAPHTRDDGSSTAPRRGRLSACTVIRMPQLVLNRQLNYRNVLLTDRPGGEVGYLLRSGERRFVPWLGFIERSAARALEDARPVRLTDITRVGVAGWPAPEWREVPPGECVHGYLTSRGAFAIYDAVVALVGGAERAT